jgi:hypothetical protein
VAGVHVRCHGDLFDFLFQDAFAQADDSEPVDENSVIRKFRITAAD